MLKNFTPQTFGMIHIIINVEFVYQVILLRFNDVTYFHAMTLIL